MTGIGIARNKNYQNEGKLRVMTMEKKINRIEEIDELPSICTLHNVFAQARAQPGTITLFKGWTRLTTDDHGEMQGAPLHGFFVADTQFVTHYDISVNGKPISHRLSA